MSSAKSLGNLQISHTKRRNLLIFIAAMTVLGVAATFLWFNLTDTSPKLRKVQSIHTNTFFFIFCSVGTASSFLMNQNDPLTKVFKLQWPSGAPPPPTKNISSNPTALGMSSGSNGQSCPNWQKIRLHPKRFVTRSSLSVASSWNWRRVEICTLIHGIARKILSGSNPTSNWFKRPLIS